MIKKHKGKLAIISVWITLLLFSGYIMIDNSLSLVGLAQLLEDKLQTINSSKFGPILPLIFVILFILRPLLLIPTWVMNVVAYTLFGPWWGYFWVILAEQLSAGIFYQIILFLSGDDFKQKILKQVHKFGIDIDSTLEKEFWAVVILRLASFPFDFVTAFCAIIRIPFKQFMLATFLISIPWAGFFFLTFDSFRRHSIQSGIIHSLVFLMFISISFFLAKRSGIIRK